MSQNKNSYDLKRVSKVNLMLLVAITLVLIGQSTIVGGISKGIDIGIKVVGVVIVSLIVFFIPMKLYLKGIIMGLIPVFAVFIVTYIEGSTWTMKFIYFVAISMVALYFKKELLIILAGFLNAGLITLFILVPEKLLVNSVDISSFIGVLVMINGAIITLYLLTKWAGSLLRDSLVNQEKSVQLLEDQERTMEEVENSSRILDVNISEFQSSLSLSKESSETVTMAMQEMASGITQQANSVNGITSMMTDASDKVKKTSKISNNIEEISLQTNEELHQGTIKIDEMNVQMDTIQEAVSVALVTVQELQDSMESINTSLSSIIDIAEQTNLLALNAAIEAARAGEHGRGFGVVSEEIKKLAEQSASTVDSINAIISTINQKTNSAVNKVEEGNLAVKKGNSIMDGFSQQFVVMKNSFKTTSEYLREENNLVQDVTLKFNNIQQELENLASISEEHAASTEEVLATTENQDSNISIMLSAVDEIKESSKQLTSLVNTRN